MSTEPKKDSSCVTSDDRNKLFANNQAMIALTSFNYYSFHVLLALFTKTFDEFKPFVSDDGLLKRLNGTGCPG